ncbi:MAG: LytTR family DNA-binding domain-containing protein [Bacteroidota bacterium]
MDAAIKMYLVDDEMQGLEILEYELKKLDLNIDLELFTDPKLALKRINDRPPQILFLDVEMPSMNGFELLDAIEQISFEVIFVTAYDHYAIQAFRYYALDYLLKPVERDLLENAISRAISYKNLKERNRIDALLSTIKSPDTPIQKIAVPSGEEFEFVEINNIISCKAENNYTEINLMGGRKMLVSKGIGHLQELLEEYHFFRSHKSYLINMQHVYKYVKSDGGYIEMTDKSIVNLARSKREDFVKLMKRV